MRKHSAPEGFIRKREAADFIGVVVRTLDNMMKCNRVSYYKFGKTVYFKKSDLLEAVEARKVPRIENGEVQS